MSEIHISQLQKVTTPVNGDVLHLQRPSLPNPLDQDRGILWEDILAAIAAAVSAATGVTVGTVDPAGAPAAGVVLYVNKAAASLWFWNGSVWTALIQ